MEGEIKDSSSDYGDEQPRLQIDALDVQHPTKPVQQPPLDPREEKQNYRALVAKLRQKQASRESFSKVDMQSAESTAAKSTNPSSYHHLRQGSKPEPP